MNDSDDQAMILGALYVVTGTTAVAVAILAWLVWRKKAM